MKRKWEENQLVAAKVDISFVNDLNVYIADSYRDTYEYVEDTITGDKYLICPTIGFFVSWPSYCSMSDTKALERIDGWVFIIKSLQSIINKYSGVKNKVLSRTKEQIEKTNEKIKAEAKIRKFKEFQNNIAYQIQTEAKGFRVGGVCYINKNMISFEIPDNIENFSITVGKKEFDCKLLVNSFECTRIK